jgi:hypothetical protein
MAGPLDLLVAIGMALRPQKPPHQWTVGAMKPIRTVTKLMVILPQGFTKSTDKQELSRALAAPDHDCLNSIPVQVAAN